MAVPNAPATAGTRIVFVGSRKDELLTVNVDQKPPGLELSGRIAQLTKDGLPIWVNLANVLYVEGVDVPDG